MLLDPEVIITGGEEDHFLTFLVESASEDVHCSVEKFPLIISNPYCAFFEHFSFLPFSYSIPSSCVYSYKDQLLFTLGCSDLLDHVAGEGPDPPPEYKFFPQFRQNI